MLPAYANAVPQQPSNAEVDHDKFHVARHPGEPVDKVRGAEIKALQAQIDDRPEGTQRHSLCNRSTLPSRQRRRVDAIGQGGLSQCSRAPERRLEHPPPLSRYAMLRSLHSACGRWGRTGGTRSLIAIPTHFRPFLTGVWGGGYDLPEWAGGFAVVSTAEDRSFFPGGCDV
jgi:hypothetical protein